MVAPRLTILETLNDHGIGVRIEFRWCGDRFGHTLYAVRRGKAVPMLTSVEGTADEPWPPSPAIQELERHTQADGSTAVIGVGSSGSSHWSLSCRTTGVGTTGSSGGVAFEVACRAREPFERVGTCYQVAADVKCLGSRVESQESLSGGCQAAAITARQIAPEGVQRPESVILQTLHGELTVISPDAEAFIAGSETICLVCRDANEALPKTVRWNYRITHMRRMKPGQDGRAM